MWKLSKIIYLRNYYLIRTMLIFFIDAVIAHYDFAINLKTDQRNEFTNILCNILAVLTMLLSYRLKIYVQKNMKNIIVEYKIRLS